MPQEDSHEDPGQLIEGMGGAEGRDAVDRIKRKEKTSKGTHHAPMQPTVVSTALEDIPKSPTPGLPARRRYHGLPHGTPLPKGTWTVPISTVANSTGGAIIKCPCCVLLSFTPPFCEVEALEESFSQV